MEQRSHIAVIGGTGAEGTGLAVRFCLAGHSVLIGSRSRERAESAANSLRDELPDARVAGMANKDAAREGSTVILTIPYTNLTSVLPALASTLANKTVVSTVAPIQLVLGNMAVQRPDAGSAAEVVQALLPASTVVAAFQTVDAFTLRHVEQVLDSDVIVCSDDTLARDDVMSLVSSISGLRPISGGRLAHSRHVEEFTAMLIVLNRIHRSHTGIRVTGLRG